MYADRTTLTTAVGSITRMESGSRNIYPQTFSMSYQISICGWQQIFFFNFEKTNYMIFPSSGRKIGEISLNMKIKNNTIERQKWWHGSCKVIGHMFIIYMNDIYTVSDRLSILLVANWGTFCWIWKSKTMLSNELRSSIFLAYWSMSSWHCHPTLEKCIKIWRTIGVLTKLKHFLHMAVLKTLYSLISPNLHFRILSWEFNSPRIQ